CVSEGPVTTEVILVQRTSSPLTPKFVDGLEVRRTMASLFDGLEVRRTPKLRVDGAPCSDQPSTASGSHARN
ncbi:MAG: hypothetical protein KDB00_28930, partial [Planctomycetales bacterium]|nr:hypothetical protein [Planctomycetales bacterium]